MGMQRPGLYEVLRDGCQGLRMKHSARCQEYVPGLFKDGCKKIVLNCFRQLVGDGELLAA